MSGFIPSGYISLRQAVDEVGRALCGGEWTAQATAAEAADLQFRTIKLRADKMTARRQEKHAQSEYGMPPMRALQLKSTFGAVPVYLVHLAPSDVEAIEAELASHFKSEKDALTARQGRTSRAVAWLQDGMFSGLVRAKLLTSEGGLIDCPNEHWASERAQASFETGDAEIVLPAHRSYRSVRVSGRVLIARADLAATLASLSSPTATVHAVDASAEHGPSRSGDPGNRDEIASTDETKPKLVKVRAVDQFKAILKSGRALSGKRGELTDLATEIAKSLKCSDSAAEKAIRAEYRAAKPPKN